MYSKIIKICPNCKTLNENVEYCSKCGELIDLTKKRALARARKVIKTNKKKESNQLTLFFENTKNHKNFIIRWIAKIFYSVWILGLAIAFVFGMAVLYLAA